MKAIIHYFIAVVFFISAMSLYSQNDIQSWQAKVNEVSSKHAEDLTPNDLSFLKSVVNINPKNFSEAYQKVVDDRKVDAQRVLKEYDVWINQNRKSEQLGTDLHSEQQKTLEQEQTINELGDTIKQKNMTIAQMAQEMSKMKSELKRMKNANNKIKNENTSLKEMMNENQEILKRMRSMFTKNGELENNMPTEFKADMERTECELADLIKDNYLLTIDRLKKDTHSLDSLKKYYIDNKKYPDVITKYITDGEALSAKFSDSRIECVSKNSLEISSAIGDLRSLLENKEPGFFSRFWKYLTANPVVIILAILLISAVVLLIIFNRRKPKIKI